MGNWAKESALCDIGERIGARWTDAVTSQDLRFNRRFTINACKCKIHAFLQYCGCIGLGILLEQKNSVKFLHQRA